MTDLNHEEAQHREHTVEVEDTPSIRGMIRHASYLLKVEE